MLSLLRRDPTLRMVPKWILVGAVTCSVIAGLRAWLIASRTLQAEPLQASPRFVDEFLLVLALWTPMAMLLAFGKVGQRCSRFDLVMPLRAIRLWAAHWLGVLVSVSFVLAASVGVLFLHERVLTRLPKYSPGAGHGLGGLAFISAAGMVLVAAILQSTQPSLYRVRVDSRRRWLVVASLLFGLALITGLSALPAVAALVPVVLTAVLVIRTSRVVPAGLTLVPATADSAEDSEPAKSRSEELLPVRSDSRAGDSWLGRLRFDVDVLRILMLGIAPGQLLRIPGSLLAPPFLFGMGLLLSGLVTRYDVLRFTNITLTVYMLVAFLGGPVAQIYIVDPLPISRRRLFALVMLPNLLAVALGYGAGWLGLAQVHERPMVAYGKKVTERLVPARRTTVSAVRVPNSEFRIAWDGRPPDVTSPWGESHAPWQVPLFKGSRAVIYSPFSAWENCSADFVALQISRAVESIYGEAIPYEEIRDRYLETTPDAAVVSKGEEELSLLRDYPGLTAKTEGPVFPVVMLLTSLLWFAFAAVYFRLQRASTSDRGRKVVFFGLLGAALLVHVLQFVAFITRLIEDWVLVGLLELLIRWLGRTLPGGSPAVWILCALLFGAGYRLTRGAFERVEVTVPRAPSE